MRVTHLINVCGQGAVVINIRKSRSYWIVDVDHVSNLELYK